MVSKLNVERNKMTIAREILKQLGDSKFIAMTGAKHLADMQDGLSFQLSSRMTRNHCNAVKITLTPMDTYQIKFLKICSTELKTIKIIDDVYNDQLQEIFTNETGLETSL